MRAIQTTNSVVSRALSLGKREQAVSRPSCTRNMLRYAEDGITFVLYMALLVAAPIPVILLARATWFELSKLNVLQLMDLL